MSYLENAPEQAWQHLVDARAHLSYAETSVALREFDWACFNARLAGKKALHALWLNRGHEPRGHILASLIEDFPYQGAVDIHHADCPGPRWISHLRPLSLDAGLRGRRCPSGDRGGSRIDPESCRDDGERALKPTHFRRLQLWLLLTFMLAVLPGPAESGLQIARRESLNEFEWSPEEARWIRDRVGLIFYGEGSPPIFTQSELIDVAHALGVRKVKTWLKGSRPGEMQEKLSAGDYKRILREFDTVLFDVCPDFMLKGEYDEEKSTLVRSEYEGVAYHLASKYAPGKTFLLSLFMETNLFFGTKRSHAPDFPPGPFFEDATEGVRSGVRRAEEEKGLDRLPKVYTVIEVAGLDREFIERYLPKTNADLYAISYYRAGELGRPDAALADCVRAVSRAVPHDGPFGKHNLMLGEVGRNVFWGGNYGEDREQVEYLQTVLSTARRNDFQYAFIFWLTDQERHRDDGWGFISSKPTGGRLRRSWHAFQRIFGGTMPSNRPSKPQPAIDAVRVLEPGKSTRVEIDIANRSTWDAAALPIDGVSVEVPADSGSRRAEFSLEADQLVTLRAKVPAPEDGQISITLSAPGIDPVTRTISLHVADIVVDRIYTEPASPEARDDVRFFAVVRNVGKAPITDFSVTFHVDDFKDQWVSWGCIWGETKLQPGESLPIGGGFLWKATPGMHKVRAWANPDGAREADYSNNILEAQFTVTSLR